MSHFLFHLGHPAHFLLFKHSFSILQEKGHRITIAIKKKDVLEKLLENEAIPYINLLPEGRQNNKIGMLWGMIKTDIKLLGLCLKSRPNLMIGTSYAISHVGKLLSIPSINVNEDDWDAVPIYAKFSYPWASIILTPDSCSTGTWEHKTTKYSGYHELAYLHPNRFVPDIQIAAKYVDHTSPYFLIRFASFKAHHDKGIQGITDENARLLINLLSEHGKIYITSERELPSAFEKYRLKINPVHIHHVMAFSKIYIGDSQTMACEAGLLGIPFIRINDFVGRLGYLNEIENKYGLGHGYKSADQGKMFEVLYKWLNDPTLNETWQLKKTKVLEDKIDVTAFLVWFIENYPESVKTMKENQDYQRIFN